jgi:hypothetical protein
VPQVSAGAVPLGAHACPNTLTSGVHLDTQGGSRMSESDLGPPAPDLAEQQREVTDEADEEQDPLPSEPVRLPLDVNEADAMEQYREVELDEDDYR